MNTSSLNILITDDDRGIIARAVELLGRPSGKRLNKSDFVLREKTSNYL
jgi:hypothetical protein